MAVALKVAMFNSMQALVTYAQTAGNNVITIISINRDDANNQWVLWYT